MEISNMQVGFDALLSILSALVGALTVWFTLKNKVAIIVGIEKDLNSPDAVYARADAKFFYEYSRKTFGIDEKNIKLLIDEKANLTDLFVALEKWLPSKVKENETNESTISRELVLNTAEKWESTWQYI